MASPRKTTTTGRLLDIAVREGRLYARRGFDRTLARTAYTREDVEAATRPEGFVKWIAAAAVARLAARSIPGALAIGGVVVAKALFDRRNRAGGDRAAPEAVDDPAD